MNKIGAITCARYAFAPNYYHYCGPETAGEFGKYVAASVADGKLVEHLSKFETLYPYLKSIAHANDIEDPLDKRVVEAYWVGNLLLNKVNLKDTHEALVNSQHLKHRLSAKELKWLYPKIDKQAKLHHSFHVFNIFTRTGHKTVAHTLETMDQCRIGWGEVIDINGTLKSQKLDYKEGKLILVDEIRQVINPIENLKIEVGDYVSFHWGYVCEKLSLSQVKRLKYLTEYHLALANETL